MKHKPLRIAIYGKGGIGKSTISANLSAVFAKKGLRVLQIGCDPKADSTRSLARRRVPTILQQLERKDKLNREDILVEGRLGIGCVEAGGPEAGCGCAGLGITAAIEELESKGIMEEPWDIILYDVLGDVVCGGFSIPMRKHYVDKVYIVTSASYMSLYAANNILKGVCRYSGAKRQLAGGLIANHISSQEELEIVKTYAERVGLPLVAVLREDKQLLQADYRHELFTELFPESDNTRALVQGAELIRYQATEENLQAGELSAQISEKASVPNLGVGIKPIPLSQEELESFGEAMARRYYE